MPKVCSENFRLYLLANEDSNFGFDLRLFEEIGGNIQENKNERDKVEKKTF